MTAPPPFASVITDLHQLSALYREPHPLTARKKIDHLDAGARAMIAASPFALLATADAQGRCTVSPKGGAPGFVTVLDEHRLAVPDHAGNNLLDSLRNLLANPHAGLLFLFPGHDELLRVEGRAWVSTDPEVLARSTEGDRRPKVAIGIAVESVFVHCSASLSRGGLWEPGTWGEVDTPSTEQVVKGHLALTDPQRRQP